MTVSKRNSINVTLTLHSINNLAIMVFDLVVSRYRKSKRTYRNRRESTRERRAAPGRID